MHKRLLTISLFATSLLTISLLNSTASLAAIYQWQDENGVTHYSDDGQPSPTKQKKSLKILPPLTNKLSIPSAPTATGNVSEPTAPANNTQIAIVSPQDQQTIRNNIGELIVAARLSQPLKATEKLRLLLDGEIKHQQDSSVFTLLSVPLGEHQLQLQLISQSGKILALSPITTIYMHRFRAK